MQNYRLYLDQPAAEWEMATPVGCASLGAMLFGGAATETIQLNEEYIWAGTEKNTDDPEFRPILDEIRRLLLEGRAVEADAYANRALNGKFHRVSSYETAGDLLLDFPDGDACENYRRELDLIRGVARVELKKAGVCHQRTLFASHPRRLIAFRLTADRPGSVSFTARYQREHLTGNRFADSLWTITGTTADGRHPFTVRMLFRTEGGSLTYADGAVTLTGANSAQLLITIDTENRTSTPLDNLPDWDALLAEHSADHSALMERADITFAADPALEELPLPQRMARLRAGEEDPGLIALYFQFGRYLLIGSSRPGSLPANLQGVWNGYMSAPWNSDYHTNINLQMNYWHAEVANLSECAQPLFDYINNYLLQPGKRVAEQNYRCRGAVLHHLSDIYRFAAPADGLWGLWPMGGAWLCYHLWEHYLYTRDEKFLREQAYPYIYECSRFFLDSMIEDDRGRLLSGPSTSPENRYFCQGKPAYLCMSPTMDVEIIGGLLDFYIRTEEILDIHPETAEEAMAALAKMPPLQIGRHGQLMEWLEDYDEPDPGHRHISHMFALYPGQAINRSTPELMKAARTTLDRRLSHGGGHTGWSAAWLISLYARLGDGEQTGEMIRKLLTCSTRDNLLDTHPPFQIDGNFGGSAGIAEMLLQSHCGVIRPLPALPPALAEGSFRGLRVRGDAEASAAWKDGRLTAFTLLSPNGGTYRIELAGEVQEITLYPGEIWQYHI